MQRKGRELLTMKTHLIRAAMAALGMFLCAVVGFFASPLWQAVSGRGYYRELAGALLTALLVLLLAAVLRRAVRWRVGDFILGLLATEVIALFVFTHFTGCHWSMPWLVMNLFIGLPWLLGFGLGSLWLMFSEKHAHARKCSVLAATAALIIAALLFRCVATKVTYSPKEHTVTVDKHNHILALGPCGMPWNYDDYFTILLQKGLDRCDASQLEMYQHDRLTIQSGYVSINRTKRTVTIDLTLLALEDAQKRTRPFGYNGTFRYVEADPKPDSGMITRGWLQDYFRTNKPGFYYPR